MADENGLRGSTLEFSDNKNVHERLRISPALRQVIAVKLIDIYERKLSIKFKQVIPVPANDNDEQQEFGLKHRGRRIPRIYHNTRLCDKKRVFYMKKERSEKLQQKKLWYPVISWGDARSPFYHGKCILTTPRSKHQSSRSSQDSDWESAPLLVLTFVCRPA